MATIAVAARLRMAHMRVLLADSHGAIFGKPQGTPNLGLLYLASYARREIPDLEFRYIPQRFSVDDHLQQIEEFDPHLYALSFTSYGMRSAFELTERVRSRFPSIPIVVGGPHASAAPEDTLARSAADICVIGEGEESFTEILRCLPSLKESLPSIRGIAYKEGQFVKRTLSRQMIENVDAIPLPARDLVRDEDYVGLSHRRARPNAEMIVMRGCPFRCVFCANPVFRGAGPSFRVQSPEAVAAEAESLHRAGYREIYMHSDELNVHHDWAVEVCKAIVALDHPDLFFQCNLRAAPMTSELASWMRKANFWLVRFGIESANDHVLRSTKKRMALEQTEEACRLVTEAGLKAWGYFLMFQFWEEEGELRCEKPDDVRRTIRFARELWRRGHLQYSSWMYAIPVHGAELYDIAVRHRLVDDRYEPGESWDPSMHLPGVSRLAFRSLFFQARVLQARMALSSGGFELRNWRGILARVRSAVTLRSS
jgi:radical SAM superfamily enzyme YgiQ (UPF0313 family)